MAADKRDPNEDRDDLSDGVSPTPEGRDLAADLPDPEVDAGDRIDADFDGIPDVEQPDEGFDVSDDNEALVAATAAAAERSRPSAPRKKTTATPRQKQHRVEERTRTGPVEFVGQSVDELKKVVWPTAEQVRSYFVVVLVFVAFIIAVVTVLDLVFGMAIRQFFG